MSQKLRSEIPFMASLWIRSGCDMKVEVSVETYQVGAHFKALMKAHSVAPSRILKIFFSFHISLPRCAGSRPDGRGPEIPEKIRKMQLTYQMKALSVLGHLDILKFRNSRKFQTISRKFPEKLSKNHTFVARRATTRE